MSAVVEFGLGWVVDTGPNQPTGPPVCPRTIVLSFKSLFRHARRSPACCEVQKSTHMAWKEEAIALVCRCCCVGRITRIWAHHGNSHLFVVALRTN